MTCNSQDAAESTYVEPVYVDGSAGRLLFTCFRPRRSVNRKKAVLCLPPFAEEMNKSRRMLALQGRALANSGTLFVLPDLFGTGDSDGEFGEAQWEIWQDNIRTAVEWLQSEGFQSPQILAVRSGIFLYTEFWTDRQDQPADIVLWSPVISGASMISQFIRTKLVAGIRDAEKITVADLREQLLSSGGLEIAGYWLNDRLVSAIDNLNLADLRMHEGANVIWHDISPVTTDKVPPKIDNVLRSWTHDRISVTYRRVKGPQFWMTPEIEEVPELIQVSTDSFAHG